MGFDISEFPTITGEAATQVAQDVGNGVPPEKSKVPYTDEMRRFRAGVEERFAAHRKEFPNAVMDIRD